MCAGLQESIFYILCIYKDDTIFVNDAQVGIICSSAFVLLFHRPSTEGMAILLNSRYNLI
jgi:hypothetical protein